MTVLRCYIFFSKNIASPQGLPPRIGFLLTIVRSSTTWQLVIGCHQPTKPNWPNRLPLSFSLISCSQLCGFAVSLVFVVLAVSHAPPLCRRRRRSFRVFTLLPLPSFSSISRQIGLLRSSSSLWTTGSPDLVPSLIPAVLEV